MIGNRYRPCVLPAPIGTSIEVAGGANLIAFDSKLTATWISDLDLP